MSVILAVTIFCGLFTIVFAVANTNTNDEHALPVGNAYEYAKFPDGLYVFRYYGVGPHTDWEIDTEQCIIGRLYVYHSTTDSMVEISAQSVSDYTCTQTALYYVTAEQKVYKTDYSGTNHEYLYQCAQGTISMLNSYFDTLYFLEDQSRIMHLNIEKTFRDSAQHLVTLNCCNGESYLSDHTGSLIYMDANEEYHLRRATCCTGGIAMGHIYRSTADHLECICGRTKEAPIMSSPDEPVIE